MHGTAIGERKIRTFSAEPGSCMELHDDELLLSGLPQGLPHWSHDGPDSI